MLPLGLAVFLAVTLGVPRVVPPAPPVPPGRYEVILETRSRRVFGLARLEVVP